ncbi:hypothetical protein HK405_001470, partial [Cladochytrium tenue]
QSLQSGSRFAPVIPGFDPQPPAPLPLRGEPSRHADPRLAYGSLDSLESNARGAALPWSASISSMDSSTASSSLLAAAAPPPSRNAIDLSAAPDRPVPQSPASSRKIARGVVSGSHHRALVTHDPFFYERNVVPPMSQVVPAAAAPESLVWGATDIPLSTVIGPLTGPVIALPKDQAFRLTASTLDLTRITNRIIASGLCWRQRTERKSHRNNIEDLSR